MEPTKSLKNGSRNFVFSVSCKVLRNRLLVLTTSRKLKKLKNQKTLPGFLRKGKTQGKLLPQDWSVRQIQGSPGLPEQRAASRSHGRNQCQRRKCRTVTEESLETQCGQLWELKNLGGSTHTGPLQYCEICPQNLHQLSTAKTGEKSSLASGSGNGNETILR